VSPLGWFHFITAIAAILVGAGVMLFTRKGTRLHRQVGWAYVVCMLALNGSALMIYRLFGTFGPFHVLALVSLASVVAATLAAIAARRSRLARDKAARAKWVSVHYRTMSWSYIGLIAAALSETATRLPATRPAPGQGLAFGLAVGAATLLVVAIGAWMVRRNLEPSLQPFKA
jgi:uncharacterized membrane protein